MNILITGAGGFVGSALMVRLQKGGHRVVPLRRAAADSAPGPTWNPHAGRVHLEPAGALDAVVHLAAENIAQRWTRAAKARIRASRVHATRLLCEALGRLPQPPKVLVCASATGYYGDRGNELLDEKSAPGTGFLPEVCQAWEAARQRGIRVVHLRLGIVLARQGGAGKNVARFSAWAWRSAWHGPAVLELDCAGRLAARDGTGTAGRSLRWRGERGVA